MRIAEEKKLPTHFTFLVEDQSLADGLLALMQFADSGITDEDFAINLLGRQLRGECQARVTDENTIIALQNQVKELQRQVSLLQKELRPKPASKGNRP
jgi:hypothetical protein